MVDYGQTLDMNIQYLVRIETDIKLGLIDLEGNELIAEDDDSKEVHFMQIEGKSTEYNVSTKVFGQLWRAFRQKDDGKVESWTITDLDDFLSGNDILGTLRKEDDE